MNDAHPSVPGARPGHPAETAALPPSTAPNSAPGRTTSPPPSGSRADGETATAEPVPAPGPGDSTAVPPSGPTRVGRYAVRRLLGRGGMGEVYLAHDPELDRPVALKVPRLAGPSAEERFLREARAAAAVSHPNLCPVYDAGRADGTLYLAMAYVPGQPLTALVRDAGPLPVARACELAAGIARGMAEAHRHGIVHRDLKPANVLLDTRRGGDGTPVVTDFGLALRADRPDLPADLTPATSLDAGTRLTQTGAILGTPAYMAPEQARGDLDRVGPAADVYALGVILFELLTGARPFAADTVAELIRKIEHDPPPPPGALRTDLPPALSALILRALSKRPEDRFPSMDALADALAPFAAPPRRSRLRALALGAAALLAVVAAGVVFYVKTDNGTVEVRLSDPAADVQVSVDGQDITVTDGTRVTRLRAGTHALEVKGPGFETETKLFRVTRGDRAVVEIELRPKAVAVRPVPVPQVVPPAPKVDPPAPPVPKVDPKRRRLAELLAHGTRLVAQGLDDGRLEQLDPVAREALELDPESPTALALRAHTHLKRQKLVDAGADARAALKLNPEQPLALLVMSSVFSAEGRTDEAIAAETVLVRVDPKNPWAWANRARSYLDRGEHRQAVADATAAVDRRLPAADALLTRAAARAMLGEYEAALGDYAAAEKQFPGDYRVFADRSALYAKTGEGAKDKADWAKARELAKASGVALQARDRFAIPDPPKPPERKKLSEDERAALARALERATGAFNAGQYDQARPALDEAVRLDPTSPEAQVLRARLYAETNDPDLRAAADEAVRLAPNSPWGYGVRGSAKARAKDLTGAIADHTIALTLDPSVAAAWNNRGVAFAQRGQYRQALADADAAVAAKPAYAPPYTNRAVAHLHLGDYPKALADYQRLSASQLTNPRWPMLCAVLRARLGDAPGAEADRKEALRRGWNPAQPAPAIPEPLPVPKLDPELAPDPGAAAPDPKRQQLADLLAAGRNLAVNGRFADLAPVAEAALALDPESPGALALRATARVTARPDPAGASADVEAALKLNPDTAQALIARALFRGKSGRPAEAVADLTDADRIDPNRPDVAFLRAEGYLELREYRQAEADAARAIELRFTGPGPLVTRGSARAFLGRYAEAEADFDAALRITADPRYYAQRAAVRAKRENHDGAAADWAAAQKLNPKLTDADRPALPDPPKPPERAKLTAEQRQRLDDHLAAFRRLWFESPGKEELKEAEAACALDPTCAHARAYRACAWVLEGKHRPARAEADEALRLDPGNGWAYAARGAARNFLGDTAGGIADLTIAVRLEPKLPNAWDARGYAYLRRGHYRQAEADFTASLALLPTSVRYQNRGTCYLRLGEYEKALADYEQSARLDALDPRARMMVAALKARLGRPDEADRKRAIALGWPEGERLSLPPASPPPKFDPQP